MTGKQRALLITGPTASGKTAIALTLAEQFNGEIISVDSALVYRGLDIGAAKPSAEEQARVPHHLIDIRDPWVPYSAAEFVEDALNAMADIRSRGRLPILAGGTSLYARAIIEGLAPMPSADATVRAGIEAEAKALGWPALHARLAVIDPEAAARIHATDPQRISRALEVHALTGQTISALQKETVAPATDTAFLKIALMPESKDVLRERISARFDQMLEQGFLAEVERLRALPEIAAHPDPLSLPAMRAVGYRQAWAYLDDALSFDAFRMAAIYATRSLAKRQLTWLKREHDMRVFDPLTQQAALLEYVRHFMEQD
ncbi:tRNA (adenosine(37)-N6)-dimethylallyltransferase MiaA [Lysobacter sp. HDW10]|uniref:tRNA (adenosine(37)-N6)-dimethylallyltransferase MiaA n=1 Tax=Lysobacter sp. HDW10 TaxID=2714936 RepID=UPI00140C3CA5|nr:tRNA (adenosine(37)-N6)-dimethylallyltransferase MiaA [Lysobacter sp. HDW10]QIK81912.1 tRNA (adenosine(37)-N6)-dimethylallyltransferase MiaA [Lysobacter sp. HDW10]